MKKAFLKCLSIMILASLTHLAFATTPKTPYHTTLEPIPKVVKHRAANKTLSMGNGSGPSTDIIVINYTDSGIILSNPTYNVISTKTSARVKNDDWMGDTEIRLSNGYNQVFFDQYVGPLATISVYVSNGQYTVNVTY